MRNKKENNLFTEGNTKEIAEQLRQPNGVFAIQVGEKMNESNLQMNIQTIENLDLQPRNNVLEIGMGNGFFVKNLFYIENSITYAGCDFSEEMVKASICQNLDFVNIKKVNFYNANANNLPFANNTFDIIFSINTIYFWTNLEEVFSEIERVLKDNGKFILTIRPKHIMQNMPFIKYGFTTFSKNEIIEIVEKFGFSMIGVLEKKEADIEILGEKLENNFIIVKSIKKRK